MWRVRNRFLGYVLKKRDSCNFFELKFSPPWEASVRISIVLVGSYLLSAFVQLTFVSTAHAKTLWKYGQHRTSYGVYLEQTFCLLD